MSEPLRHGRTDGGRGNGVKGAGCTLTTGFRYGYMYHGRLPVNQERQTLPTPAMYTLALRRQTCRRGGQFRDVLGCAR